MRFQPTIGDRPMYRRAVFVDVATCAQECMVDRADRYPASMIGLNPVRNFQQLRHGGCCIGKRAIFFEFHVPRFLSYRATVSVLASGDPARFGDARIDHDRNSAK
jgi:hypothetical protein